MKGKAFALIQMPLLNTPERNAVLSNLNLSIAPNKITALVGHTGAGKTTIANLAMRTYDVSSYSVDVSGIDIREILDQLVVRPLPLMDLSEITILGKPKPAMHNDIG